EANVIFGVKQTPVDLLIPNKTYCFFSHTIKAQEANMPMLDAILAKVTSSHTIKAQEANMPMLDAILAKYCFFSHTIKAQEANMPMLDAILAKTCCFFSHTIKAQEANMPMLDAILAMVTRRAASSRTCTIKAQVANMLMLDAILAKHIGPAHNYRSSSMARQAIRDAGYEVSLGMMPKSLGPLTFVRRRHHLERKNGGGYDHQEYEEHPERYISTFAQKIAPYTSVLINGIYWAVDSPKLLTLPDAKHLLLPSHTPWLPKSFQRAWCPGVLHRQHADSAAEGAIITSNGKLTPSFEYINELRQSNTRSRHKVEGNDQQKPVVILGSGLVSAPVVEYLSRDKNIAVTVASASKEEADALTEKYGVKSEYFEANDEAALKSLASKARLVVSLLPYDLHGTVARAAKEAGVTFLNEVGLDPGIDHLLALECIHNIQNHGGRIDSFVSYCGGLPAPEFSDNALRYKFSWNPRGVLLNTISAAKYLSKGQIVEVLSGGELMSVARDLDFLPGFAFEGFPNRDSTMYASLYGIEEAHTMFRGTLRYKVLYSFKGPGVLVCSIDNMPTQLPRESTDFFGDL
ncbi:putative Aminoadipic semialdehyde synthase, partial [Operophtera brumata]